METLILGWYVLVETGSVLLLTLFASLGYIGTLVAPMFGVAGDRIGHRHLLAMMRTTYAVLAAVLMTLALTGYLAPLYVFVIAALMGIVRPSDLGVRGALVATIMGRVKAADGLDQLPFRTLIELMTRDEKCWVKVCGCERVSSSGPPFHDAVPFARRIVETAPDRVIWGTDWPHPNVKVMPNDGDLVDLIPLFAPEPELQQKILVDNPARLFEF